MGRQNKVLFLVESKELKQFEQPWIKPKHIEHITGLLKSLKPFWDHSKRWDYPLLYSYFSSFISILLTLVY